DPEVADPLRRATDLPFVQRPQGTDHAGSPADNGAEEERLMARMPGARWQGEHGSRRMDRYDIVCVHTIVGYAPAHAAHFSVKANGEILQSRDTAFRSAANLNGNHRVIAIENEDHG